VAYPPLPPFAHHSLPAPCHHACTGQLMQIIAELDTNMARDEAMGHTVIW